MSRAQFFKDCKANQNMTLTLVGGENYEWIKEKRPQNLKPRKISKVQTNAVYLEGEENRGQGSYLEIPQSSLMDYDGTILNIYNVGVREMTDEERKNEEAAQIERNRFEKENPYSDGFWHMKSWFSKCSTPWVSITSDWVKGKKRGQGDNFNKILDKSIKGELILSYKVEI